MSTIANKQAICDVLMEYAKTDRDIVVTCSDSRGSASMTPFADTFPEQFVEVGIAEQNVISISAGMARCGKKAYAVSPACFLSTRSMEQAKVDVAYSDTNVKLVGISGGISYGALGMTHHSAQDIAAMSAIPNMRVYLPSDSRQTKALITELLKDEQGAYIRVGRNPVADIYTDDNFTFTLNKATTVQEGDQITLIATGEMVAPAKAAGEILAASGISTRVLDIHCVKPLDNAAVLKAAKETKAIITVEEHSLFGGLGSMVSQIVAEHALVPVKNLGLPDAPVIAGPSPEVFAYYNLTGEGIAAVAKELLAIE